MVPILLSRDEFREAVFKRDKHLCVCCKLPAQDAHHLMERRLWEDGGYYLDNGVSLCAKCHLLAENTVLPPRRLMEAAGITKRLLPSHLYEDYEYTKWGDIENANGMRYKGELFYDESVQKVLKAGGVLPLYLDRIKYPRTLHLPFSPGATEDDKFLPNLSSFRGREIVVTVKMDGENTTGYQDGYIHARSIDSDNHPSRNWVKNFLAARLHDLPPGYRICGENLFAKHSIHYRNLSSYFQLFSIWDEKNNCLSWDHTKEWADLLGVKTVPEIYRGTFEDWEYDSMTEFYGAAMNRGDMEGYIVRWADSFNYSEFRKAVGKFVRANHVAENTHWIKGPFFKNELAQ